MSESSSSNGIWERMILEEQRREALERGYVRVSDYEEDRRFIDAIESSADVRLTRTDEEGLSVIDKNIHPLRNDDMSVPLSSLELDEYYAESESSSLPLYRERMTSESPVIHPDTVNIIEGSSWWRLSQELVDDIILFLGDVDMLGYLKMVSKTPAFQASDRVYKILAQNIYLSQTGNPVPEEAHLRFNSWRNLLILRPRLRTNGLYSLRTIYSKAPCNERFWEDKLHEYIEVKYYRHFRFFNGGRVLYSLDNAPPDEIAKLFRASKPIPRRIYEGTYKLVKREVRVEVRLHYCIVIFVLFVLDSDMYSGSMAGKHNRLRLVEHSTASLSSSAPWNERTFFALPNYADLSFYRYWNWS